MRQMTNKQADGIPFLIIQPAANQNTAQAALADAMMIDEAFSRPVSSITLLGNRLEKLAHLDLFNGLPADELRRTVRDNRDIVDEISTRPLSGLQEQHESINDFSARQT